MKKKTKTKEQPKKYSLTMINSDGIEKSVIFNDSFTAWIEYHKLQSALDLIGEEYAEVLWPKEAEGFSGT